MNEPAKFSYTARRLFLKISVSISSENVDWAYSYLGNTWNHSTPLSTLEPYPMFSEIRSANRWLKVSFPIAVAVFSIWILIAGWSELLILTTLLTATAFVLALALSTAVGSTRWATFESNYRNRDVYFCQGSSQDEFELFVRQLTNQILNARLSESQ